MTAPPSTESGDIRDVFVRRGRQRRYSLVEAGLPAEDAYRLVFLLRNDPDVDWAYCSDPKLAPANRSETQPPPEVGANA
jgi:hypothetical protein